MIKVVFFLILMMPGADPIHFEQPVENFGACIYEQYVFALKPSNKLLLDGGLISIGCSITYPKSIEH